MEQLYTNWSLDDYHKQLQEVFRPGGYLSRRLQHYEQREEQLQLALAVAHSLYRGEHLMAEAGTGVGKSFAYLMAAALWALQADKKVVISTYTIPLQSQLVEKDLPLVQAVLEDLGLPGLRYELAKGRHHYICKRRLQNLLARAQREEIPEVEQALKLWSWLDTAQSGDRREVPEPVSPALWQLIEGDADDCYGTHSPFYERCFIQQARRRLHQAHLIVANHALFFADLAMKIREGSGVLPTYDHVIFDEAHHVEEVFSRHFSIQVSLREADRWLNMLKVRSQGWMQEVLGEEDLQLLQGWGQQVRSGMSDTFDRVAEQLFAGVSAPADEVVAKLLHQPLDVPSSYHEPMEHIWHLLQHIKEERDVDEPVRRSMEKWMGRVRELYSHYAFIAGMEGGEDWAHWVEWRPDEEVTLIGRGHQIQLRAQPIQARSLLPRHLFSKVPVTMVSATLATGGHFRFVAGRLGLDRYQSFVAASPFPYHSQALLVVSERGPVPNHQEAEYERFLVEGLKRILRITLGRTLVLFTSYRQMQRVHNRLLPWATEQGLTLLLQQPGGDREGLLSRFASTDRAVLLGADSFWEGIDLPGELLKCVVITRLPFANPAEPVHRARMAYIEREGGNAFASYVLPSATLRLKQGFGRLIRSASDRGAVVIMDSRVVKKGYGKQLLASLPPARRGKLSELAAYAGTSDSQKGQV